MKALTLKSFGLQADASRSSTQVCVKSLSLHELGSMWWWLLSSLMPKVAVGRYDWYIVLLSFLRPPSSL